MAPTKTILLFALALLLFLAAPSGAAQAPPSHILVQVTASHSSIVLPPDGRSALPLEVKVTASGFVCAYGGAITFDLGVSTFPKWAGARVEPHHVNVPLMVGEPGLLSSTTYKVVSGIRLEMTWDVENAPLRSAQANYTIMPTNVRLAGTCTPVPTVTTYGDTVHASMADRTPRTPEIATASSGAPSATPDGRADDLAALLPAPSPAVAITLIGMVAVLMRRRSLAP